MLHDYRTELGKFITILH